MRIGLAGFGKMGAAMAHRLVDVGAELTVWNRDPTPVAEAGLPRAASPRALARHCELVISSLFDDSAARAVYEGREGLIAGAAGTLFVEMSTLRPETQRALAGKVEGRGGAFIECPVSGSTGPARAGELLGLCGGSDADLARARPLLKKLCRRVEHIGPVGTGATAKLAINLPLLAFWQSFGEAMALMQHLDRDPAWLVQLFSDTAGTPAVMKSKADAIQSALSGEDTVTSTFDIDAMRKDLRLMLAEASTGGFSLPVAGTVLDSFDQAAAAGWGKRDCAWIPAFCAARAMIGGASRPAVPRA